MDPLRRSVLSSFKKLHRTSQNVFAGHEEALFAARTKINEEYRKNIDCREADKIQEKIKFAESVEAELRCTVVQAVQTEDGKFEATFRKDVQRLDNVPFDEFAILDVKPRKNRKCKPAEE